MKRSRNFLRLGHRYQLLLAIASLVWVRGFLLPSPNHNHEVHTKQAIIFNNGPQCILSSWDTSMKVSSQDSEVEIEIKKSAQESPIRVKKSRKTWNNYYPRLKEFYTKHGHSNVTAKDDDDLYTYAASLRKRYSRQIYESKTDIPMQSSASKNQQLSEDKIQALEEIQFVWQVPKKKKWGEYFPRLLAFHSKHGHCNVTPEDDKELNKYLASLRKNYIPVSSNDRSASVRSKSKRKLPDDKLKALENLGFSWDTNAPPRTVRPGGRTWEEYFPRLQSFYKEHGHSNVTADDDEDLFKYVSSLRKNYRHQYLRNSKGESGSYKFLPQDKFQALQDLDFSWYVSRATRTVKFRNRKFRRQRPRRTWTEYYSKLEEYHKTHGHCNVTSSDNNDLYQWIKSLERRNRLPGDKLRALEELGVTLQKPSERRRLETIEMTNRLKLHEEKYGRVFVSRNEDNVLKRWTAKYALQHGYSGLWELIGLPPQDGKWRNGLWDQQYQKLEKLHSDYGHCRTELSADYELEVFVRDQRREYIRLRSGLPSILTQERIDLMEQIEFKWTKTKPRERKSHEARWNEMFEELKVYRKKYGHTEVPQEYEDNPQLGRWVMNQRTFYRMNQEGIHTNLDQDRIDQLEEIDFVWGVREKQWLTMFGRLKDYQKLHGHVTIESSDFVNEDLRQWLNEQRYMYKSGTKGHRLNKERIEALESLSGFRWSGKRAKIPTKDDWSQLLGAIRERGILPQTKAKEHWFDGVNPFEDEVKSVYSDDELVALWNEENDDADNEDEDNYFEDEDSRLFLRA